MPMKDEIKKAMRRQEEDLEILNNRLRSATYFEDKMEALEEMYLYSQINPVMVGIICFESIYESLYVMDGYEAQCRLMESVLRSSYKKEFIEMVFKHDKNVEMFFSLPGAEANALCSVFASEYFFQRLTNYPGCGKLVLELVKSGYMSYVEHILRGNETVQMEFLFGGGLEMLMANIYNNIGKIKGNTSNKIISNQNDKVFNSHYNKISINNRENNVEVLVYLLVESRIAHDYFLGNELYNFWIDAKKVNDADFQIMSALLTKDYDSLERKQSLFFVPRFILSAVNRKIYTYLNCVVRDNWVLIEELCKVYLNHNALIEAASRDMDALDLLWKCRYHIRWSNMSKSIMNNSPGDYIVGLIYQIVRKDKTGINKESDEYNNINTFIKETDTSFSNIEEIDNYYTHRAVDDILKGNMSKEVLLYIIFTFKKIDIIKSEITRGVQRNKYNYFIYNLSVILLLQHGEMLELNKYEILDILKTTRKMFCSESVINDYFTEMLIILISDLIHQVVISNKVECKVVNKNTDNLNNKISDNLINKSTDNLINKSTDNINNKSTDNIINKSTDNIINKNSDNIINKNSDNIINKISDNLINKSTDNINNKSTDNIINKSTDNLNNKSTDNIINKSTDNINNKSTDNIINKSTDNLNNKISDNLNNKISDNLNNKISDNLNNKISDKIENGNVNKYKDSKTVENIFSKDSINLKKLHSNINIVKTRSIEKISDVLGFLKKKNNKNEDEENYSL